MTKLRLTRLERGLNQSTVEKLSMGAVRQHRLSEIERGMPTKPAEAMALSAVFGLPISELGITLAEGAGS
jgi:transcriptional regulator with XRE-family HTH domain